MMQENDWKPVYSLDELMEWREKKNVFFFFCGKLVKRLIGRQAFAAKAKTQPMSKVLTIPDEAMIMLIIKNCYDRWVDAGEKYKAAPEGQKPEKTTVKTLYTSYNTGNQSESGSTRTNEGWSSDGIAEFNRMVRYVTAGRKVDRKRKKDSWEREFIADLNKESPYKERKRVRKQVNQERPVPISFLGKDKEVGEEDSSSDEEEAPPKQAGSKDDDDDSTSSDSSKEDNVNDGDEDSDDDDMYRYFRTRVAGMVMTMESMVHDL